MKGTFPGIALQVFALNCSLAALGAEPLLGQETRVYLDAGVSHARPPAETEADPTTYGQLGGRLVVGPLYAALYGGLAMDEAAADWIGGTLAASAQFTRFRKPGFGFTGLLSAFSVGEPNRYDAIGARAIPELYIPTGPTTVVLRGYGGIGRSEVTDATQIPAVAVTTDLWMLGGGAEVVGASRGTRLWGGVEGFDATSGTYLAAYAGSSGTIDRAIWSASLKVWETPGDTEVELNFTLALPIGHALSLQGRAGRTGPDPLLDTPASVDGSATLTWDVLAPLELPQPVYSIVDGPRPAVRFQIEAGEAESVELVGDFSSWDPIPMTKRGDRWVAELELAPGLYHFGFLVDGEWRVPDHSPGIVADEFGRENATVVVPAGDPEGA